MPDSALDKTYDSVTKFVVTTMDSNAQAINSAEQVKWFNFKDPDAPANTTPIYDSAYLDEMFNRDRLNKNVSDVFANTSATNNPDAQLGGFGKVRVNTAQLNRVARWHRDLSGRFKSRVRAIAHRASEINSDGTDAGQLRTSMVGDMTFILKSNSIGGDTNPEATV